MKYGIAGTLAASVIIAAAGGAKAQDDTVADDTGITPTGIYLDTITVFATLSPMATFEFPGQVTVVEREELETEQANSIQDVLENVPGVFVDGGTRRSGQAPTIVSREEV
jgi:hemoglobin/transferrin/lactoferrin receptor protein